MEIVVIAFLALVLLFGFVVFFGAPYLPTLRAQTKDALDLLDLKPGQTLLELGSGDGTVLLAAAQRGIRCIGYELNPILVVISRIVTWRYRRLVTIKMANYWSVQWPQTDGIYVFLLQKYMTKLDTKVTQYTRQRGAVRLVSFAFTIPNKKPVTSRGGLTLYVYDVKNKAKR